MKIQRWRDCKPRSWAHVHIFTCDTEFIAATTFHIATARTTNCKNIPIAAPRHNFTFCDLTLLDPQSSMRSPEKVVSLRIVKIENINVARFPGYSWSDGRV
jgi:hypothetical protein